MDENNSVDVKKALLADLVKCRVELAHYKRKKRILLEEIHRQYLEGELDPKKRAKTLSSEKKKPISID